MPNWVSLKTVLYFLGFFSLCKGTCLKREKHFFLLFSDWQMPSQGMNRTPKDGEQPGCNPAVCKRLNLRPRYRECKKWCQCFLLTHHMILIYSPWESYSTDFRQWSKQQYFFITILNIFSANFTTWNRSDKDPSTFSLWSENILERKELTVEQIECQWKITSVPFPQGHCF